MTLANDLESPLLNSKLSCISGGKASKFEAYFEKGNFNFVASTTLGGTARTEKMDLLGVENKTTTDYDYNVIQYPVAVIETKSFILDLYRHSDVYPMSSSNRYTLTIISKMTKVKTQVYCDIEN